ncbi:MAG: hypothetical protein IJP69_09735 [Synergistaceae bacterium]|nr:hypothetical protein [Synergistaceae bacterium]MBR0233968.1 hypothetical protein [Synergistaceae bacterium]
MKKILNFVIVFALIILTCGMSKQGHSVLKLRTQIVISLGIQRRPEKISAIGKSG